MTFSKKEIKNFASANNSNNRFLIHEAIRKGLSNTEDWYHDTIEKVYTKTFTLWGNVPNALKYYKIEHEDAGLEIKIYRDYYDDVNTVIVKISENAQNNKVQSILKDLKEKREQLLESWRKKAKAVAFVYFLKTKDDYLRYPVVYASSGFRSPCYVTWNCQNREDDEMVKKIGHLNNSGRETLSESQFIPSFWESNEQLKATVDLGEGYRVEISRKFSPDWTFHQDWSDVSVCFEKYETDDTEAEWKVAFEENKEHIALDKNCKYRDFERDLGNAEWIMEKGVAVAYIPIIYEQYAEYILEKAEAEDEYKDMFKFEVTKRHIPFFDSCGDEPMTCIKVTLKD